MSISMVLVPWQRLKTLISQFQQGDKRCIVSCTCIYFDSRCVKNKQMLIFLIVLQSYVDSSTRCHLGGSCFSVWDCWQENQNPSRWLKINQSVSVEVHITVLLTSSSKSVLRGYSYSHCSTIHIIIHLSRDNYRCMVSHRWLALPATLTSEQVDTCIGSL